LRLDEVTAFFSSLSLSLSPIYIILPAALCPGVYSASNINKYQKQKEYFWGVERGRCVGLTTLPTSVSRYSRQCGILNISQLYLKEDVKNVGKESMKFDCGND
jgi:hypothetical protein